MNTRGVPSDHTIIHQMYERLVAHAAQGAFWCSIYGRSQDVHWERGLYHLRLAREESVALEAQLVTIFEKRFGYVPDGAKALGRRPKAAKGG